MSKKHYGKTIRLSQNTMNKLAQKRIGFETPDECINRALSPPPQITVTVVPDEKEKKLTVTTIE